MDTQDFAVLANLAARPRASYEELGEAVGLTANAVKARVHKLALDGVLQGVAAIPRASLLGLHEGLLLFTGIDDLEQREDEILRGLAEVPGVRYTDSALDGALWIWLLYRDDAEWERLERAAVSLVGKPPARAVRGLAHEPPARELAPGDWKVLHALQHDGRASAKDLANRAGLTFKPLKRRLDALLRSGDVRLQPIVSPADARGLVLFRVILFLAPDATAPPAPPMAVATQEAPGVVSVLAARATLREAQALQRDLAAAPGVERAHLQLASRRASLAWLDEALVRCASAATAPIVAAPPVPRAR